MAIEVRREVLTNLQAFRAGIRSRQLARTERFECHFKFPNSLQEVLQDAQTFGSDTLTEEQTAELVAATEAQAEAHEAVNTPGGRRGRERRQKRRADRKVRNLEAEKSGIINKYSNNMARAEYDMALMCEEVQIPGMVLQNKELPIGTWQFYRNTNLSFLGNEINITFLTDKTWFLRHMFEAWMGHCVNPTSKQVAYPDDQFGEIWINALDLQGNITTTWELMEVTPKVLNLIPLASAGVSIARTTLIISSGYWRSKTIDVNLNRSTEAVKADASGGKETEVVDDDHLTRGSRG